jgi:NAD(P)-dependent dehydrogenase (short-subunit alcohol dehydrogenase family)
MARKDDDVKIDLTGKRAMVTGSTSGMGYAMAKALAEAGAAVVVNGRTEMGVAAAVERVATEVKGAKVNGTAADVVDPEAINDVTTAEPRIDILVNNAGPTEEEDFFDISDED